MENQKKHPAVVAALIIGITIFLSVVIYSIQTRYQPYDEGSLILDSWTGKIYLKNGRPYGEIGKKD